MSLRPSPVERHLAGIEHALTRIADLMEANATVPQIRRAEAIAYERVSLAEEEYRIQTTALAEMLRDEKWPRP